VPFGFSLFCVLRFSHREMSGQVKLEDSNISAYGSKEHKDVKLAAAKTETAWEGAGKQVGLQIWRIEKFKVVAWPKEQYGKFHKGDAYIVLNTYKKEDKILYNVHFWLGCECTQDEQGTAAYKTVELDDLLGDLPVQFREVEGSESKEFLELFKGHIFLLAGGVESGFKNVKPEEYKPRLFHMKGKKDQVRVDQVQTTWKSLNDGDVFLLDMGLEIFQWNGKTAGIYEKRKAQEISKSLQSERNGRPKVKILDGLEDNDTFWKTLGGKPKATEISPATSDDVKVDNRKHLFQLSDSSGTLKQTKVAEGTLKKSHLVSDDVMIVDVGIQVYAWIGKGASKQERAKGIKFATDYLETNKRPNSTPVVRALEGSEPAGFWTHFS